MTNDERLAKNNRIREQDMKTREKRKSQNCRVYLVKIDFSHLNEAQKIHLLDKDRQPVTHELRYISSQMIESVIQGLKHNINSLASLKRRKYSVGGLRCKSDYASINLQQYRVTYRFYDSQHIGIQGFKGRIRIKVKGANQFWNIPGIEFANAKLLNLASGYYLAVMTYRNKTVRLKKYKSPVGIDMGIKASITTSNGRKIKVLIEETERKKKCQRLLARRQEGFSNRFKASKLLRKAYKKLLNEKRDTANKIVHELLEHEKVFMQDENLRGWHKGLFGCTVHHSVLGLVKRKLIKSERVIVLPSSMPTTKYCPVCKRLKKDITLSDRIYQCE